MASTVIQPLADQIKTTLGTIALTPTLKAYRWAPADLDSLPAAVIELPDIRRPSADETELVSLGANSWLFTFPVTLYFDLSVAEDAQNQAADYLEDFIQAVDANRGLSGQCLDASVISSELVLIDDRARPLLAYECQLEVLKEVAYP